MAGIDRQAVSGKNIAQDCQDNLAKTINACLETKPQKRLQDFERVLAMLG